MFGRKILQCVFCTLLLNISLWTLASSAVADMAMTEANRPYSVRFQDWVYLYLNTEFLNAAPPAPDYTISVKSKIIDNKVRYMITGYYFDTKLGRDWYERYASQLHTTIAMLCHTWTQQGHPTSPDDFEINIREEKLNQSN
jgi:hypothetical protein